MRLILSFISFSILSLPAYASFLGSYKSFKPRHTADFEVQNESADIQLALRRAGTDQLVEKLDPVNLVQSRTLQRDRVFSSAIQLLESLKSSPSCSRIAATRLLTSCQSLSGSDDSKGTDIANTLDQIKSIYAVRLAICELREASTPIPMACSPLHVSPNKPNMSPMDAQRIEDITSPTVLQNCLNTMESRPQWWTSYSNNRQNALVICQAARIEVEKEEMLNLHQTLLENIASMNKGLHAALHDADLENSEHRAFAEAVRDLRAQTLSELQDDQNRARGIIENFTQGLEATIGFSMSKIQLLLKDAETSSTTLNEGIRGSSEGVRQLHYGIQDLYNDIEFQRDRIRVSFERDVRDMESNHELALAMRSSLSDLGQTVSGVDGALEWLIGRFASIQQQESLLVERLREFETHLENTNDQANSILQKQALQAEAIETQARAQEALGASTRIAHAMVDRLTARAMRLETALEETSARFNATKQLNDFFGVNVSAWTICSLLLSIIAVQNPRMVLLFFALAGLGLLYKVSLYFISIINPW